MIVETILCDVCGRKIGDEENSASIKVIFDGGENEDIELPQVCCDCAKSAMKHLTKAKITHS